MSDPRHPALHALDAIGASSPARPGERTRRFGGNAVRLADLRREGLPVPSGWVLEARAFEAHVAAHAPRGHALADLVRLAGSREGVERAARARDRVLGGALEPELDRAIAALAQELARSSPHGIAVRSSGTAEDGRTASMAGLACAVLGVRGADALARALREVWASALLPQALDDVRKRERRSFAMAVLLMPMTDAVASGVMFTAPPPELVSAAWPANERWIEAGLGLGAPIVEGEAVVDRYRLARDGRLLEARIADKSSELVPSEVGVVAHAVEGARRTEAALDERSLAELATIAARLDRDGPTDVEFAVEAAGDATRVVVLQARPVTSGPMPEGGDEATVWTRATLGEALPGPATPLTWSVASRFAERGFRAAFEALGCSVPKASRLLANVDGRFYLNLSAFVRIAAQVPFIPPRRLIALAGGVPERFVTELERCAAEVSPRRFVARAPFVLPRLAREQLRLGPQLAAWEAAARPRYERLRELDLELLPDDALVETLRGVARFLDEVGTKMLEAASASMVSHLALAGTLATVLGRFDDPPSSRALDERAAGLAHTLTAGMRALESAEPGLALARITDLAREEPAALEALRGRDALSIDAFPEGPTRQALDRFLEAHGDRAPVEAELCTPRWAEDPSTLFAMIETGLRGERFAAEEGLATARASADHELGRLEQRASMLEIAAIRALVGRCQETTRLRERMRVWVARALGAIRRVALDVDRRLRRLDPALEPDSAFFCTFDELLDALRTGRVDFGPVVRLRRAEHARNRARPDPPATFAGRPIPVVLDVPDGTHPRGIGASPGVVEGRARVVHSVHEATTALEPGEILVARTTDVGLTPLFLVAAGIVTELGGALSHAAIIAREYGVPAVVGIAGITSLLRTGERLRIDGTRGVVARLDLPDRRGRPLGP